MSAPVSWVQRMTDWQATEFVKTVDALLGGVECLREMNRELRAAPPGDPDAGQELWDAANAVMDGAALLLPFLDEINDRRSA